MNGLEFVSEECPSIGPCAGTCVKCDREAAYLRNRLAEIPLDKQKYLFRFGTGGVRMIGDIMSISRLRMGTDGKGVSTLVAFFDCPLHCIYCAMIIAMKRILPFRYTSSSIYTGGTC